MQFERIDFDEQGVTAEVSTFRADSGGTVERHIVLHVSPRGEAFQEQLSRIYQAEELLFAMPEGLWRCLLKRYFLSDSANQQPLMREEPHGAAVSVIQQPPLDGSKVAVWMYMVSPTPSLEAPLIPPFKGDVSADEGNIKSLPLRGRFGGGREGREAWSGASFAHNGYRHLWTMGLCSSEGDSYAQTRRLLLDYEALLARHGATLADNCVRTWFFVRDVDTQYAGMVRARRENFIEQGLTERTHYIASTGIGGSPADTKALIQLGAYALTGMEPGQQKYLYAPTHLNPTHEYGVTFERGVRLDFGDRRHIYISGTASINNKGQVEHAGDVIRQTHRMWENAETLLAEADAAFSDVAQIIVYLRDTADYDTVRRLFRDRFPSTPCVITLAPVCRPAWLIEMECIAVKSIQTEYREF